MFNFDSHICMLELVLCLGRDGVQDPGFCLLRSRLWFFGLLWSLHDSFTGWMRPCLSLLIDPYWMAAPIPWIWIFMYSAMDGYAHTTYIMYLRYQLYFSTQVFRRRGFSWTCSRKAFHPSLSLGPHTLGGICYTVICHCPYHSLSRTMEDPFCDLWTLSCLETIIKAFL